MTELLTQSKVEDAVASTNAFLYAERGANLDGGYADGQVQHRVQSVQQRAQEVLESVPHPKLDGLYVPLSKFNASRFVEVAGVLPGYMVLIPSAMVEQGSSLFYPAIVSEDGLKSNVIRLHVLKQAYRQKLQYGAAVMLSAAGQSETTGIGEHGRKADDGIEAEHFSTLLAAGSDLQVQEAWRSGRHINHAWRQQSGGSVTSEVSKRLFGSDVPQETVTITKEKIESGKAMLLWHRGMNDQTGKPETATQPNALVIVQGLGFEALQATNPRGIDEVRKLLA